jgi:multidrug transporter EmrE-like cation transporter
MSYVYVAGTLLFTVLGQLVLKWQLNRRGESGADPADRISFLAQLLANPWVLTAVAAGFAAALCWMLALNRLPLSHAYPFMALSFVLVLFLSALLFAEPLTWAKVAGVALICAGVALGSQG